MRKQLLRGWAIAAAMLLGSCASLPLPGPKDTALLVIPVRAGYPTYSGFPLAYEFGLAETELRIAVTVRNGVAVFSRLPPGTYNIDRVYTVAGPEIAGGLYTDGPEPEKVGPLRITLKRGEITILPVTVAASMEARGPETHVQNWTPIPTDRNDVLAQLARYDHFATWRIADTDATGDASAFLRQVFRPRVMHNRPRWD